MIEKRYLFGREHLQFPKAIKRRILREYAQANEKDAINFVKFSAFFASFIILPTFHTEKTKIRLAISRQIQYNETK